MPSLRIHSRTLDVRDMWKNFQAEQYLLDNAFDCPDNTKSCLHQKKMEVRTRSCIFTLMRVVPIEFTLRS